jgi:hypothetical protein
MTALRILLVMLDLATARGEKDIRFRWALAEAIAMITDDPHEQDVLVRLAWFESGFRRNVARCETTGDHGRSFGTFQIQPITRYDRSAACGALGQQVELALRYVHRSAAMCPKNEGAMKLACYVSGRCDRGQAKAKARWGVSP